MTIKPPPSHVQQHLFELMPDKPLMSPGESRTRYGRVVEEIMCKLLDLEDIPNNGTYDVVFDAYRNGVYCEIKSVRHGGKIPLYEWRRRKDAESGVDLVYVIAIHRCKNAKTLGDVWTKMASTISEVLIVPAREISRLACLEPVQRIVAVGPPGERMGYKRKGYADGYRNISLQNIRNHRNWKTQSMECEIYGLPVNAKVHSFAP